MILLITLPSADAFTYGLLEASLVCPPTCVYWVQGLSQPNAHVIKINRLFVKNERAKIERLEGRQEERKGGRKEGRKKEGRTDGWMDYFSYADVQA